MTATIPLKDISRRYLCRECKRRLVTVEELRAEADRLEGLIRECASVNEKFADDKSGVTK